MVAPTKPEKMDVDEKAGAEPQEESVAPSTSKRNNEPDMLTFEDIREQVRFIDKSVSTKDARFIQRVMRSLNRTKKHLNANVLRSVILSYLPVQEDGDTKTQLLAFIPECGDGVASSAGGGVAATSAGSTRKQRTPTPEAELYLHLLVVIWLLSQANSAAAAVECARLLTERVSSLNRRTLDPLAAKAYHYFCLSLELAFRHGDETQFRLQMIRQRPFLLQRYRTAVVHSDLESQATLLNLLLRNYILFNHYSLAAKLISRSIFPTNATNGQLARYHFYLGQIKLTQLDYSIGEQHLQQALRKAPQLIGQGFRMLVQKWLITCQLLLGEIPGKDTFTNSMGSHLRPYYELTSAVREGNLTAFEKALGGANGKVFHADSTHLLIRRLHHNVLKTGLKRICSSYSRISMSDVAKKLCGSSASAEDAEFIVAKAIRDGVVEAKLVRAGGMCYMESKDPVDIYNTKEPLHAFNQRIKYCLDLHNQSVKALRFPSDRRYHELESADERREREQLEMEAAKEMSEDDFYD